MQALATSKRAKVELVAQWRVANATSGGEDNQSIGPLAVSSEIEVLCVASSRQPFEVMCNSVRTIVIESLAAGKTSRH